ncbi:hypothetical protein DNU06_08700 [Putridiphycobacter roseus]|uniref:Translocation protein TolB n=1 Tax=Putridiphycobacter roseus TaxID=2219161 RepID=A0A2W1MYR7_9FLAO|nr:PD40 domain-containing protein [Putridiphycobacter roseus]PZE17339.1 hypothetical protein DNU06_08700 [Putridiphycobacter roseus]
MVLDKIFRFIVFATICLLPSLVYGQFYQGSNQEYGKNRVQYSSFGWKSHNYKRFRIYYSSADTKLAYYSAKAFDYYLREAEQKLEFKFPEKMEVIVFENHAKFKQSNIGLLQDEQTQIAGTSRIFGSKIFVYYEANHQNFNKSVKFAVYEALIKNMLLGNDWKNVLKSSVQSGVPDWMEQGLIRYLTVGWDSEIESRTKDLVLTNKLSKFNNLSTEDKIYAGHAMWNYIGESYGKSSIPAIINLTRYTQSIERSLYTTLSLDFQKLNTNYIAFYKGRYVRDYKVQKEPTGEEISFKKKKDGVYYSFKLSSDGKHVAYVENRLGQYRVKLLDLATKKRKTIYKAGTKLERIQDYSFPVLEWHPKVNAFSFYTIKKDKLYYCIYILEEAGKNKASLTIKPVTELDKVIAFDYSSDGKTLILSGVKNGQTDLYTYSVFGGQLTQITNDLYDELEPKFTNDNQSIAFVSNRESDTIFKDIDMQFLPNTTDIFTMDVSQFKRTFKKLKRITNTPKINEHSPLPLKGGSITYLSEQNGIDNRFIAKVNRVIDYIDTSIHYRDEISLLPQTNYVTEIREQAMNSDQDLIYLVYQNNNYKLYRQTYDTTSLVKFYNAGYLQKANAVKISNLKLQGASNKDTVYINNVYYQKIFVEIGKETSIKLASDSTKEKTKQLIPKYQFPKYTIYNINFTKDFLVTNFDNTFLFPNYQIYQGPGSVYINPGLNSLTKIGASDLFDDYKLVGGIRIPLSLNSGSETLLSFENLRNRLDHRLLYYRQKAVSETELSKSITHDIRYRMSYPISETFSLRLTTNLRQDKTQYPPGAEFSEDVIQYNSGLNFEMVFDNSIPMELNIRRGLRLKVFAEYLQDYTSNYYATFNLGIDLRSYTRITRNFIWVNRIAGATSLGSKRLLYYMGAVNNWVLRPTDNFNFDLDVDPSQNYGYQTIATPLRGFIQNTRNGNSFALLSTELRLPIFSFLSPFPINSEFFRHFQIVAFGDVGSAWTGPHPLSPENYFNNHKIDNYPIQINIQNLIEPIVGDVGFGFRSKLMGYFIKLDIAWGIEDLRFLKPVTQISLNLDI